MRNFKFLFTSVSFILSLFFLGCSEDEVDPAFAEVRNQEYDLVVVSDGSPNVPVSFSAAGTDLERVTIEITPQGSATVVAKNSLNKITTSSLNRVNMPVPFPANDVAPSGMYTVNYKMFSKSGEQSVGTYDINIVNNVVPIDCNYSTTLPAGKNTWVRLYLPEGESLPAGDTDIYMTGNFETREGGKDWSGGENSPFKFTRLSPTCYEMAMNLEDGDLIKFTRGAWAKEMAGSKGAIPGNMTFKKVEGKTTLQIIAFNWADRPTIPGAETLDVPAEAVKPGMMTFIASLDNSIDAKSGDYYVVEKGATNIANGYKMVAFAESNMIAAAVPKTAGVEYMVVKGNASATGKNRYGFAQSATWNGKTNPVSVTIDTFGAATVALGNKIVIVGGATPGDWGVTTGQDFTKTGEGKYSITINLKAESPYLLLPNYGQWNSKWGVAAGDAMGGTLATPGNGGDFNTKGLTAGTYKIDVDFTVGNGTYKVTKQ